MAITHAPTRHEIVNGNDTDEFAAVLEEVIDARRANNPRLRSTSVKRASDVKAPPYTPRRRP